MDTLQQLQRLIYQVRKMREAQTEFFKNNSSTRKQALSDSKQLERQVDKTLNELAKAGYKAEPPAPQSQQGTLI
jgi:hypothetical protein